MVHIIVRHKVADYSRWKEAFDNHLKSRKSAGETDCRVLQSVEDPRDITLLLDWSSMEQARKYMGSDDLKQAMQSAGVISTPEVNFLQDAQAVRRTAAD